MRIVLWILFLLFFIGFHCSLVPLGGPPAYFTKNPGLISILSILQTILVLISLGSLLALIFIGKGVGWPYILISVWGLIIGLLVFIVAITSRGPARSLLFIDALIFLVFAVIGIVGFIISRKKTPEANAGAIQI